MSFELNLLTFSPRVQWFVLGLCFNSIQYLRDINDFFGVRFKIVPFPSSLPGASSANTKDSSSASESEDDDDDDEEEQEILGVKVKTGRKGVAGKDGSGVKVGKYVPEEYLISCLGIGYGNFNKSMA